MKLGKYKRWTISAHVLMAILSFLALVPFVLLIMSSITEENTVIRNGYSFFPEKFSLDAFKYIFEQWQTIGKAYINTAIVTLVGTVTGVTISAFLGYMVSRKELPGRSWILFFITFTMMFSGGLTAQYIIYTKIFHLKDTIFGLIIPSFLMNGYYVMTFRNYFENTIPESLLEAAKIDGATEVKVFWKIVLPLSGPIVATIAFPAALLYWNDWINGTYYLTLGSKLQTIQTILNNMNENIKYLQNSNLGVAASQFDSSTIPTTTVRMAIAVVGIAPVICAFPFIQRWLVRGLTVGAVKE